MDAHQSRPGSFRKRNRTIRKCPTGILLSKVVRASCRPPATFFPRLRRAHLAPSARCRSFRRMRKVSHSVSAGCNHPRSPCNFLPAPYAGRTSRRALGVAAFAACGKKVTVSPLDASIRGAPATFFPRPAQCSRKERTTPGLS